MNSSRFFPWLEKFEKVSHLMVRCSGRCHMLGGRMFFKRAFCCQRKQTASYPGVQVSARSLLTIPRTLGAADPRRARGQEIPGLCNPRARTVAYRHAVSFRTISSRGVSRNEEAFVGTSRNERVDDAKRNSRKKRDEIHAKTEDL